MVSGIEKSKKNFTHPPRTRRIFPGQFADLEVKSGKWIILFLLTPVHDCFFGGWLRMKNLEMALWFPWVYPPQVGLHVVIAYIYPSSLRTETHSHPHYPTTTANKLKQ